MDKIDGDKHIITLFRDPKKRILSLYYFWKSHTYTYLKENDVKGMIVAKELGLLDFLKYSGKYRKLVVPNIDNSIAFQISDYKYDEVLSNNDRETALNMVKESALSNLQQINNIGILEQMSDSIEIIMRDLGIEWDGIVPETNTFESLSNSPICESVQKEEITKEIEVELEKFICIDQIIYDEAVKIFNKDQKNDK